MAKPLGSHFGMDVEMKGMSQEADDDDAKLYSSSDGDSDGDDDNDDDEDGEKMPEKTECAFFENFT